MDLKRLAELLHIPLPILLTGQASKPNLKLIKGAKPEPVKPETDRKPDETA